MSIYEHSESLTGMVMHRRGLFGGLVLQVEVLKQTHLKGWGPNRVKHGDRTSCRNDEPVSSRLLWRDANSADYEALDLEWRACGLGKGYRPVSRGPGQPDDDNKSIRLGFSQVIGPNRKIIYKLF